MLIARGDVNFKSPEFQMNGSGETLKFEVKNENLKISQMINYGCGALDNDAWTMKN